MFRQFKASCRLWVELWHAWQVQGAADAAAASVSARTTMAVKAVGVYSATRLVSPKTESVAVFLFRLLCCDFPSSDLIDSPLIV